MKIKKITRFKNKTEIIQEIIRIEDEIMKGFKKLEKLDEKT